MIEYRPNDCIPSTQRRPTFTLTTAFLQVRVGRLTRSYRLLTLPRLQWFQGLVEDARLFAAIRDEKEEEILTYSSLESLPIPDAWVAKRRKALTQFEVNRRHDILWVVSREEVRQVIEMAASLGEGSVAGPSWFWAGCFWKAHLILKGPAFELELGISISSQGCLPCIGVKCTWFSYMHHQLPRRFHSASFLGFRRFVPGRGINDTLPVPAPLKTVQQLNSYLSNGQTKILSVKIVVVK